MCAHRLACVSVCRAARYFAESHARRQALSDWVWDHRHGHDQRKPQRQRRRPGLSHQAPALLTPRAAQVNPSSPTWNASQVINCQAQCARRATRGAAPTFHTRHPPSLAPVPRRSTPRPRSGTPHRSSTARRSARGALPGGRCGRPRRYERRRRRGSVRNHRAPGARAGVGNARRQTAPPAAAPRPARPAALRPAGSDAAVAAAAATAVAPSHRWVWRRPPHPPPRAAAPPAAAAGRSVGHLRWWRAWGEGECVRSTRHGWPS